MATQNEIRDKVKVFLSELKNNNLVPPDCLVSENRIGCYKNSITCPYLRQEKEDICKLIGKAAHMRKEVCQNFGTLNLSFKNSVTENIKKCKECPKETYEDCEITESLLKRIPNLEPASKVKAYLREDILHMRLQEDGCFGKFEFMEIECFDECDFKVACIRETRISEPPPFQENFLKSPPDSLCRRFPRLASFEEIYKRYGGEVGEMQESSLPMPCEKCPFYQGCKAFIFEIKTYYDNINEGREIFKEFLTLSQIRKKTLCSTV